MTQNEFASFSHETRMEEGVNLEAWKFSLSLFSFSFSFSPFFHRETQELDDWDSWLSIETNM